MTPTLVRNTAEQPKGPWLLPTETPFAALHVIETEPAVCVLLRPACEIQLHCCVRLVPSDKCVRLVSLAPGFGTGFVIGASVGAWWCVDFGIRQPGFKSQGSQFVAV